MRFSLAFALGVGLSLVGCGTVAAEDGTDGRAIDGPSPGPAPPNTTPTPPAPPAPVNRGLVLVFSLQEDHFGAIPSFWLSGARAPDERSVALGQCRLAADPAPRPDKVDEDAGDIVVSTSPAALEVTVPYDAAKRAYGEGDATGSVRAGAPIVVRGSGGQGVPAFEGQVDSLAKLPILAPREGDTIQPTDDLVVRWSFTDNEPVFVELGGSSKLVVCQFAAASGTGIVPRALVQEALASASGANAKSASISVRRSRSTHVIAGTFDVEVMHVVAGLTTLKVSE